jgi:hypothetical protein
MEMFKEGQLVYAEGDGTTTFKITQIFEKGSSPTFRRLVGRSKSCRDHLYSGFRQHPYAIQKGC